MTGTLGQVVLNCVARRDVASRLGHLMHVGGRTPIGIIAPARAEDSPTLPRPHISCVVVPASFYVQGASKLERAVLVHRPEAAELRYNWSCEYLGYDAAGQDPEPPFSVTFFAPPRGREVAFISFDLLRALHDGGPVTLAITTLENLW